MDEIAEVGSLSYELDKILDWQNRNPKHHLFRCCEKVWMINNYQMTFLNFYLYWRDAANYDILRSHHDYTDEVRYEPRNSYIHL